MATGRSYFNKYTNRFLSTSGEHDSSVITPEPIFQFDEETEMWSNSSNSNRSGSPDVKKSIPISKKKAIENRGDRDGGVARSMPIKIPDWSKILKDDSRKNVNNHDFEDIDVDEDDDDRLPPPEYFAKKLQQAKVASFSVHEGRGRTLKGRDLRNVREAIWERTGFQA